VADRRLAQPKPLGDLACGEPFLHQARQRVAVDATFGGVPIAVYG
jgi:hypothetical protein